MQEKINPEQATNCKDDSLQGPRRSTKRRGFTRLFVLVCTFIFATPSGWAGVNLKVQNAGGITFTASGNDYLSSFGTMNGLGVGAPSAGVSVQSVTGGALYYSAYNLFLQGGSASTAVVSAYVSTQFAHTSALVMQSCPSTAACTVSTNYATLPTISASAIVVVPTLNKGGPAATASFGIFVPYNNGASAYTGTDSVVITFVAKNGATTLDTTILTLNNPVETVQKAIAMTLSSDPAGVPITSSSDFSMNFGSVNGMGISPAAGLSTSSVAGGMVYSTPYRFQPSFSGFGVTTASVSTYVSTDFIHPAILELRDSSSSGGPYTAISKLAGTPTNFGSFNNLAGASSVQRYLGLFVSSVNGATAFTGSDSAVVTFVTTPQ